VDSAGKSVHGTDGSDNNSGSDHGSTSPSVHATRNREREPSSSVSATASAAPAQSASTSSGAHQTAARSPADSATGLSTHTTNRKRRAEVASHRDEPLTRRQTRSATANGESTHEITLREMTEALLAHPDVLDQLTTALNNARALLAVMSNAATSEIHSPVAAAAAAAIATVELEAPRLRE
jgi:hypothetical protein